MEITCGPHHRHQRAPKAPSHGESLPQGLARLKVRSRAELEALAEENSALYGNEITQKLILKATEAQYSFLWLNLRASDPRDLFWLRFEARLIPRGPAASDPAGAARS